MELLIINDGKTIVTLEGFMTPFRKNENLGSDYISIPEEIKGEAELLRQIISFKLYEDRQKLIPAENFYKDQWDVSNFKVNNLKDFLESVRLPFKNHELYQKVRLDNGDIVILTRDKYNKNRPHSYNYSYTMTNATGNATGTTFYANTNNSTSSTQTVDMYIEDTQVNNMTGKGKFHVIAYTPQDEEEAELLMKYLDPSIPVATTHCILIAIKYQNKGEKMYSHFSKKTPTKVREIYAPKDDVKAALRHMLLPLNSAYDMRKKDSNQFAYTTGRSIKDNAVVHKYWKYVIKTDVRHFFDQCHWGLAKKYLKFLLPNVVQNDLVAMAALKEMMINPDTGGLYQGSPVSGALTNAIMKPAAKYMKNMFDKLDMNISIYADDITVSFDDFEQLLETTEGLTDAQLKNKAIKVVTGRIRYIFEKMDLPFTLHPDKSKLVRNNGRKITGVRINHKNQITIDRKKYRLLRSICHRLANGKEITMNDSKLMGNIAFFRFIDETGKVANLLWLYRETLAKHGIVIKDEYFENFKAQLQLDLNIPDGKEVDVPSVLFE
jgi:RNA-directed DNA polymerase